MEGVSRTVSTFWGHLLAGADLGIVWEATDKLAPVSTGSCHIFRNRTLYCYTIDVDECSERRHNCGQVCENTQGSFTCSCNDGFSLDTNRRTCIEDATATPLPACGGRLTAGSGSFQTDGWPTEYRQENFVCEWTIEIPNNNGRIEFTIDRSAFGVLGRAPGCSSDHIQFFDGTSSNANSLQKICGLLGFYGGSIQPIVTRSSSARVVFTGTKSSSRPSSRVGVRVTYRTV